MPIVDLPDEFSEAEGALDCIMSSGIAEAVVEAIAAEAGATPAQVALAWLLAKGDDIAPIPGTRRVSRIEENTAADGIELTAEQISRLDNLTPAAGSHHEEADTPAARPVGDPPATPPPARTRRRARRWPAPSSPRACAGRCPECRVRCADQRPCYRLEPDPDRRVAFAPRSRYVTTAR